MVSNEIAPPAAGALPQQGARGTPAVTASEWSRRLDTLRESVWLPVLTRVVGATVLLGGLATVGIVSAATLPAGVSTRDAQLHAPAYLTVPWLASPRAAPSPAAPASASSTAPAPSVPAPNASTTPHAPPPSAAPAPSAPPSAPTPPPSGITADGKVILNLANATELTRLPGVGQKRAEAILALRERLGRFRRPTDLLRVRGIGPASLQKMSPHFVLDPPPPAAPTP